jgi:hypothetical protein
MGFDKKDLETIAKVFAALSKAKWDSLDGNAIIEIHGTFVALRKLEEKIKEGVNPPVKTEAETPKKKSK